MLRLLGHERLLDPDIPPIGRGEKPSVLLVGDIIDRGDRIVDSLRLVGRLWERGHLLSVMGNHDHRFERWLRGKQVEIHHGLQDTIDEFEALPRKEQKVWRDELIEFFGALPWVIGFDGGKGVVAHAAWRADLLPGSSDDRVRAYAMYGPVTGRKTPEGFPERIDWAPAYRGPEFVIFGHQVYPEPYRHDHAIGIDTGCVFGGALTALRYPSMEIVSVPSRGARYHRGGGKVVR